MNCVIQKLEIENFMCFKNTIIEFSEMGGIISISGINNDIPGASNGTGKSSGPMALFYCIYGKSAIRINNKSLVNKYTNEKGFSLTTTLEIDNTLFKIHRGADVQNNSFLNLYKFDKGEYINITASTIAETDIRILNLLNNLTPDLFLKTVYLTLSYGVNFFQMSRNVKNEFLNLISGTSKLHDINSRISKDINEYNTDIRILDAELVSLDNNNKEYIFKKNEFLNDRQKYVEEYNKNSEDLKKEIESLKNKLKQLIEDEQRESDNLNEVKKTKKDLNSKIQKLELNVSKLKTAQNAIILKNDHINEVLSKNKILCDSLCEVCTPKANNILHMPTLISDKEKNNILLEQIIKGQKQSIDSLKKLEEKFKKLDEEIKILTETYNNLVNQKNKEIRNLDTLEVKLHLLEKNYKNSNEDEPFSSMIESTINSINKKHSEKTDIIKNRQQLSILKFATDSETIHKFVTSRFVKDINFYLSKYLNMMGVNYYCEFDNDLSYSFITPVGEMQYDNFSSGEKMRLNIAMSFALRQLLMTYLNINVNILILDEYLDSNLDVLAINGVTEILSEIKQNAFYKIFLISHRKEFLSSNIDNNLVVTKTNGISEIKYN